MTPLMTPLMPPPAYPSAEERKSYEKQTNYTEKDEAIRQSILDPVLFCSYWLGAELWQKQQDILYDIFKYRKVAVKSCHASGKSFVASCAVLSFLARYPECVVVTTGPTARQVFDILWKQIRILVADGKYPFPEPTVTTLTIKDDRYAVGFTTSVTTGDLGVRFQGYHSKNLLIIADEAAGVNAAIYSAIEGILSAGNTHLLCIGNPTISSGIFYDAFGRNKAIWKCHTISAFDTPNFKGLKLTYKKEDGTEVTLGDPKGKDIRSLSEDELDVSIVPFLISRRWFYERLIEWGPTNPLFISRCLGGFPAQAPDALISSEWIEAAENRDPVMKETEKFSAGIDVAGPGECETVLVVRKGGHIVKVRAWPQPDPRGELVAELIEYKGKLDAVNVDVCGIGYYLARHLEDNGIPVADCNVGEAADDPTRYSNLKAEAYWGLRMWLASDTPGSQVSGLRDEVLQGQLAGIRYKTNARGQIVIESKEEAAKRGVPSPDRAEAMMLAFARPRQHGLIDWWAKQAEALAEQKKEAPVINTNPIDLANAQKLATDSPYQEAAKKVEIISPDKKENRFKKPEDKRKIFQTPSACPKCANDILSIFSEGIWKCCCGTQGVLNQMYDEKHNLIDIDAYIIRQRIKDLPFLSYMEK